MDIFAQMKEINRPPVKKQEWMDAVDLRLATVDDLDTIAAECIAAGVFGLDLETTGLDQRSFPSDTGRRETVDKIVGYCIAPSTEKGWYIPVRHREDGAAANVPPRLVGEMITAIQEGGAKAVFHNAKFDTKFLDHDPAGKAGDWDDTKGWEDTLILAYLRNTRDRRKGLKSLSKRELEREMIELEQLFPPEAVKAKKLDFSTLDPTWEPVVWYAAADAVNTLALFHILHPQVVEKDEHGRHQQGIYRLEKACMRATVWMEDCRIHIDRKRLEGLIRLGQQEWWDCLKAVYAEASEMLGRDVRPSWLKRMEGTFDPNALDPNYMESREVALVGTTDKSLPTVEKSVPRLDDPKRQESVEFPQVYDVTIPANLGVMLREIGVKGLSVTEKSGQVKTSKDELDRVIKDAGEQFPFMAKVRRFRQVAKALGTNLFPIYWDTTPERSPDGCVWANFNAHKVDTGRFSTPTPREKRKEFFHGQVRWNVHSTPATYDKSAPDCSRRTREIITARPGHILFAIDYSGVELRIATCLSGEPKWRNEFFRCSACESTFDPTETPPPFCPNCGSDKIGDIHTLTALSIFGEDIKGTPKFKQCRQIAKGVNFGLCYGGGGSAVSRTTGVSKEEGWRIKNQFDKTYRTLRRWWSQQHRVARDQLYVTTAYGRKYPVPDINHSLGGFKAKAERNSVNGPVQGSSADIMKLAMAKLYKEFKKRGWLRRVLMTVTIHDELVFEIEESLVKEALPVIEHVMVIEAAEKLKWPVPLKVDIEFGEDWTVPYNLTEMMWDKGGGEWTERWVRIFPEHYAHYLSQGGKAVVAETPPASDEDASDEPSVENGVERAPPKKEKPPEKDGSAYVYRVPKSMMTPESARRLATVVAHCIGKGSDTLHIKDADGNDLIGGAIRVAYEEFRVIAAFENLDV